jgi:hypothetical protein
MVTSVITCDCSEKIVTVEKIFVLVLILEDFPNSHGYLILSSWFSIFSGSWTGKKISR